MALVLAGCGQSAGVAARSSSATQAGGSAGRQNTGTGKGIDETSSVVLPGNVPAGANPAFDRGAVDAATPLSHMMLLLEPAAGRQAELDALLRAQQDSGSALYHHWLTPAEFGARFGASAADMAQASAWLQSHGFAIDEIPAGNRLIVFSGTAGGVADTFHTELRHYNAGGEQHIANALDPEIPSALASVVAGVVSLNDFRRSSAIKAVTPLANTVRSSLDSPAYSAGSTHYLFPADFATIYNVTPVYSAGLRGAGAAIAIAGRSRINLSDVATFRSYAGLAANTPTVTLAGSDPGLAGTDQNEATLDVEWAGAVAPQASVRLVTAASTATTDGIDLASAYIVNHATAPVVSVSYISCEQSMGAAELAFYNALWEQAAAEGMSVFVASGDAGAAGCNAGADTSGSRKAVNGLCSSPYATCVGGTELNEGSNAGQYWSATNGAGYESALGYIPEQVWNESASNSGTGLWASGGGISTVYAQPEWQSSAAGAATADGMRAVPDVSLSAADHDGYFMIENGTPYLVSGTSAAAPSLAGILALIEAKAGAGQGNANPQFYSLAEAGEAFHPTPAGDNSVPGVGGYYASGATYNLATGLGSVDAAALQAHWNGGASQPPTLSLAAAANTVAVNAGSAAGVTLNVTTGGSYTGSVALSVAGLGNGVTVGWSANPVAAGSSRVTLLFTASERASQGTYSVVVTASGNGLTSSQAVSLEVEGARACSNPLARAWATCGSPLPMRAQSGTTRQTRP